MGYHVISGHVVVSDTPDLPATLAAPTGRSLWSARPARKLGWLLLLVIAGLNVSFVVADPRDLFPLWVAGGALAALACSTTAYRHPDTTFARVWRIAVRAVFGLAGLLTGGFGT